MFALTHFPVIASWNIIQYPSPVKSKIDLGTKNVYLDDDSRLSLNEMTIDGNEEVTKVKNDLDKLSSLPIGSIIQIEKDKDDIETTKQKYGWQYLGTSNIQYENGGAYILETNVYRKNN